MRADTYTISEVFNNGGNIQYFLPHFQRQYAWEKKNWQVLLNDIYAVYQTVQSTDIDQTHFMGALVVIEERTERNTPVFKLVDGQQRLTTVSLILLALRAILPEGDSTRVDLDDLLLNKNRPNDLQFKLLPTTKYGDRSAFQALVTGRDDPHSLTKSNIPAAFAYIFEELRRQIDQGDIEPEKFYNVVTARLRVVRIDLDPSERPYEIFESLNAKGKDLSQGDLVRNYIALRLPPQEQETVFDRLWSPIEEALQENRKVGRLPELTAFLRHYLALQDGSLANEDHVYERFRDRCETHLKDTVRFIDELESLKNAAHVYDILLRPESEPDRAVREALQRLNILDASTAYPLLMRIYGYWQEDTISRNDLLESLSLLENYLVRRFLTGEQSNFTNRMFPLVAQKLPIGSDMVTTLRNELGTRGYPTDASVRTAIHESDYYEESSRTLRKLTLILETINRALSDGSGGYTILDGSATIEHIMPQKLSADWRVMLGADAEAVQNELVDTLGNLTLLTQPFNSSFSNNAFAVKRERLRSHALRLNSAYFEQDIPHWDREAIFKRADFLTDNILQIWGAFHAETRPANPQVREMKQPIRFVIQNEPVPVASWRDVIEQTALFVQRTNADFGTTFAKMPVWLTHESPAKPASWRRLPDNWWVNVNVGENDTKRFLKIIFALENISQDEVEIETKPYFYNIR